MKGRRYAANTTDGSEYDGLHGKPSVKIFYDTTRRQWRKAVLIDIGYGYRHPRNDLRQGRPRR